MSIHNITTSITSPVSQPPVKFDNAGWRDEILCEIQSQRPVSEDQSSDCDAIIGPLFLGNVNAFKEFSTASHVVSILSQREASKYLQIREDIEHFHIVSEDGTWEALVASLPDAFAFIDKAREKKENKILVHCLYGISRSPTVLAAYLYYTLKGQVSIDTIFDFIQLKRSCVKPNSGLEYGLKDWINSKEFFTKYGFKDARSVLFESMDSLFQ